MMPTNQRRLLPSTSMLAAFDSAARLGSFSAAAKELSLTQGAISRQIRALEEQLGVSLFERTSQHVTLTDTGARYAVEVSSSLSAIRAATLNAITNTSVGELRIAILPTFGSRWLIPRLSSFLEDNLDIDVSFVNRFASFDFNNEQLDAAIHYGQADWPKADCTFLMSETVVPVYAPALGQKYDISRADDFRKTPLLHLSTRHDQWQNWFRLNGIEHEVSHGIAFEQFSFASQAAIAGLGVALMPRLFVENELKTGTLIGFDQGASKSSSAYYLVAPKKRASYAPLVAFREWIVAEAEGYYIS
ncbi:MAG: LysR family transcriptional regulator [Gammaproteobacteria bacterium]|nr:LysR family transcriptional regulator [Gammaproteobacteria bacterium]